MTSSNQSAGQDEIRHGQEQAKQPLSTEELFRVLEYLARLSEKKYIIRSYPAINTLTLREQ